MCSLHAHACQAEVMWCRYSNVVLAEPHGSILLCAYQVGSKMSSARQLQTGGRYQLPPKPQGIAPDIAQSLHTWQQTVSQAAQMVSDKAQVCASVADGLVRAYQVCYCCASITTTAWHLMHLTICLCWQDAS